VIIVENWAIVTGRIAGVTTSAEYQDFSAVELDVEKVTDMHDYPNLLRIGPGSRLPVLIRQDVVRELEMEPGDLISVRTRKGGKDRFFAHPSDVAVLEKGK
jgi:hypothetical protein